MNKLQKVIRSLKNSSSQTTGGENPKASRPTKSVDSQASQAATELHRDKTAPKKSQNGASKPSSSVKSAVTAAGTNLARDSTGWVRADGTKMNRDSTVLSSSEGTKLNRDNNGSTRLTGTTAYRDIPVSSTSGSTQLNRDRSPIRIKTTYTNPDDIKMATRQTQYNTLRKPEKLKQEEWAQLQIRKFGACIVGYGWHRVKEGYRCYGGTHFIPDGILTEGIACYYEMPGEHETARLMKNPKMIEADGYWWIGPFRPTKEEIEKANEPDAGATPKKNPEVEIPKPGPGVAAKKKFGVWEKGRPKPPIERLLGKGKWPSTITFENYVMEKKP